MSSDVDNHPQASSSSLVSNIQLNEKDSSVLSRRNSISLLESPTCIPTGAELPGPDGYKAQFHHLESLKKFYIQSGVYIFHFNPPPGGGGGKKGRGKKKDEKTSRRKGEKKKREKVKGKREKKRKKKKKKKKKGEKKRKRRRRKR